jgi:hypothetical protein
MVQRGGQLSTSAARVRGLRGQFQAAFRRHQMPRLEDLPAIDEHVSGEYHGFGFLARLDKPVIGE